MTHAASPTMESVTLYQTMKTVSRPASAIANITSKVAGVITAKRASGTLPQKIRLAARSVPATHLELSTILVVTSTLASVRVNGL